MIEYILKHDEQSTKSHLSLDPLEMVEHLVLDILVGSHRRNMKLLETLQGASVLSIKRWNVHTCVLEN